MPTYIYETIPAAPDSPIERFELRQGFNDPPLATHPSSGQPVQRVISGGLALLTRNAGGSVPEPGPDCGPETCSCGRFS